MEKQKKIALINDLTGFGRCSTAVMAPIVSAMKIQAVAVPKTKFHMTLKELERENDDEGYFRGAYPEGSMIVMCDCTENQLVRLLMDFRNRNVKIDYKMVMTATNASWDVLHVYFEAQKEKMMYEMAQRDRKKFPFR